MKKNNVEQKKLDELKSHNHKLKKIPKRKSSIWREK